MKFVITGVSSGLGHALARRLIGIGDVVGLSRTLCASDKLLDSDAFQHLKFDLANFSDDRVFNRFALSMNEAVGESPVTLVLNAASFYSGNERLPKDRLGHMFELNFFSVVRLVEFFKNKNLRRVFFVNSVSGLVGQAMQHEYSASKHAVMGYARSLSKSAKNSQFDVMCINPGGMRTPLWEKYPDVNQDSFLSPDTVAEICVSLLSIEDRLFITELVALPDSDL